MLTDAQLKEAIAQMITQCDLKMVNYEQVCARSVLYELGYEADAHQILEYIAAHGFDYCLDRDIKMTGHHEASGEYPNSSVCWWGPDQLKSRLQCLRS